MIVSSIMHEEHSENCPYRKGHQEEIELHDVNDTPRTVFHIEL